LGRRPRCGGHRRDVGVGGDGRASGSSYAAAAYAGRAVDWQMAGAVVVATTVAAATAAAVAVLTGRG